MRTPRPLSFRLKLSVEEDAALRARAQEAGVPVAEVLRRALELPPPAPPGEPTHDAALELLYTAARAGSVPAAVALERSLRPEVPPARREPAQTPAERLERWQVLIGGGDAP